MADGIGTLALNLVANTRGFERDMKRAKGRVSQFSREVKGMAASFVSIGAGMAIVRDSIQLAIKQQQAEAKVAAVIRATGEAAGFTANEIKKLAEERQKLTTLGDEEILAGAAALLTFKNIKGEEFTRTIVAMQDMTTVLGGDMVSAAKMLGKALSDPTARMGELSRAGIILTDTQKDLIRTMQAAGNIVGAQGVLLDEFFSEFGGASEAAAKTAAGAWKQLGNTFGDVKEEFGSNILSMVDGLRTLASVFKDAAGGIEVSAKTIADSLVPALSLLELVNLNTFENMMRGGRLRMPGGAAAAADGRAIRGGGADGDVTMGPEAQHELLMMGIGMRNRARDRMAEDAATRRRDYLSRLESRRVGLADIRTRGEALVPVTPEDQLRREIATIRAAFNANQLTAAQTNAAALAAENRFAASKKQSFGGPLLATALLKGSQQAYNAIAQFSARRSMEEKQLALQREANRLAQEIADNTEPEFLDIPAG